MRATCLSRDGVLSGRWASWPCDRAGPARTDWVVCLEHIAHSSSRSAGRPESRPVQPRLVRRSRSHRALLISRRVSRWFDTQSNCMYKHGSRQCSFVMPLVECDRMKHFTNTFM